MAKTYVPQLRWVLQKAHKYGTRWLPALGVNLTTEQMTCLVSTLAAINDCLVLLGPAEVRDLRLDRVRGLADKGARIDVWNRTGSCT